MSKLLLVDGNSMLNRAFYGLPDMTTADGRHTGAILGFIKIVQKVAEEISATHMVVAFDMKHPTFRHEMFKEYKGTRHPMPPELAEQSPVIREVLASMNVKTVEMPGFEADDILGTLSRVGEREGYEVVLLSGDRDLLQLATEKIMVKLPKTKGGKTVVLDYYAKDVEAEYGVSPCIFIDMKGLMGDSSDNIPGVPKIGEKTAAKLLTEFGSMDGLYAHIDELKPSKNKENLIEYREQAYLSRELATIRLDCPVELSLSECEIKDPFNAQSYKLFYDLELKSLMKYFDGVSKEEAVEEYHVARRLADDFDSYTALMEKAKKKGRLALSLIMAEGEAVGASVTIEETEAVLVPFVNFVTADMLSQDVRGMLDAGAELIMQDVKQALAFLDLRDGDRLIDAGLCAYLVNPLKSGYDYRDLAREYLSLSVPGEKELLGKDRIANLLFATDAQLDYAAYTSMIPFLACEKLTDTLKEQGMKQLYEKIELPCLFTLYEMEKNGIRVNKEDLAAYGERLSSGIEVLTREIYELAGEEFNINSTKQLGEVLFEKLGLPSGKKTKTGYSTSVEVLEKLTDKHEIVGKILEYRTLTKLNSTYVEGLSACIKADGRIHGKFNQTVTATGRISSTDPNLQNIPTRLPLGREIRKVFVPEEGFLFLDADYSQIELRVLAHFSGDEALIEAYHKDSDIHAITASQVFNVPMDEVDSLMRRRAKAVNFGIVYGISSFGLGQDLDISRKEAEQYIEKYFETYPGVKAYIDGSVADAKEKGYSLTMYGRRRPIPELASSNFMTRSFGERVAMNAPIQGTAADIIKIAMIRVYRELKKRGLKSRLVLQVHDELLIETAAEEKDEVKALLAGEMMAAAELLVPLIAEVGEGNTWYDAH